jgi:hypothetical protein
MKSIFLCKIQEYAYFWSMIRGLIILLWGVVSLAQAQEKVDTLEGWWTMENGQHYFEDQKRYPVLFVGEELWGMDDYYAEMVPEMGFPVQAIITAVIREDTLMMYSLMPSPEGCED